MADNTVLSTAVGTGDTIATDDISSVKYPRSKITLGADGVNDGDVSSSNPMPVTHAALTELAAAIDTELQVDVVTSALPSGAATSAKQDTGNTSLSSIDGKITACNTGAVVVSSSALPSGAATAAKQPALGTAGTPSADVITVQGVTSMTALKVDGSAVTQPVSGTVTANLAAGTNAIGKLAANSGVDIGDVDVTSVSGNVTVVQGTATNLKAQAEAYQGGTAVGSGNPLQVTLANGSVPSHAVTNAGTFVVQENGAALTALQLIDNPVLVDDAAFTPATSSVMMAGFQADESSTDSVNEGDAGAARITLDRKQIVTVQPHTAGGVSTFKSNDIDETEEDVKTSAGQVYFIYCVNTNASARYLKLYNATAASVTVGSTATKLDLLVPPSNSGFFLQFPTGIVFDTAISVAATTGLGDSDSGAPGASEVQVTIGYV